MIRIQNTITRFRDVTDGRFDPCKVNGFVNKVNRLEPKLNINMYVPVSSEQNTKSFNTPSLEFLNEKGK